MRNKKWMAATFAGCITVMLGASVGFALPDGAFATVMTYPVGPVTGTGPVQPPSPAINCSAWLRRYSVAPGTGGYPTIVDWTVVQGNSLAACTAAVNQYLYNRPNESWALSPGNPLGCICAEPGLGSLVDHGGYAAVSWDSAKDAVLNVKLQALREEFHIDEYYQRVNEVVNQELSAARR